MNLWNKKKGAAITLRTGTADPFGPTLRNSLEHALSHGEVRNEIRRRKRHRVNFARF